MKADVNCISSIPFCYFRWKRYPLTAVIKFFKATGKEAIKVSRPLIREVTQWKKKFSKQKWVFVYRYWCEENEMVFVSHEVPFPATSDRRSRVAGNGTECEVKSIELSSPTSGDEQWAFLNFIIFIAVKKTLLKLRKVSLQHLKGRKEEGELYSGRLLTAAEGRQ